jgi:hypothetical protein
MPPTACCASLSGRAARVNKRDGAFYAYRCLDVCQCPCSPQLQLSSLSRQNRSAKASPTGRLGVRSTQASDFPIHLGRSPDIGLTHILSLSSCSLYILFLFPTDIKDSVLTTRSFSMIAHGVFKPNPFTTRVRLEASPHLLFISTS